MRCLSLAIVLAAVSAAHADEPAIRAIDESYQAAVKRIYAAKNEADEKAASNDFQALRRTLVERSLALAADHPGDPASVEALTWVIHNGGPASEGRMQAIETLRRDYMTSDRLGEACRWASNTVGKESLAAENLLRDAIVKSPHREVRGRAYFSLAELLEARADMLRDIDKAPEGLRKWLGEDAIRRMKARTIDDLYRESDELYGRVARTYADLAHPRTKKPLGEVAEGRAYKLRNLSVGRTLPEIAGVDVEGKPLKLSGHRGKVILLTFSGLWCPSCHSLYPVQRELLKQYKGRPFSVLSVDTDEDKAPLRKAIASGEINWPCWWDGSVGGPITVRHGIYYFPTVFLIDHKGVVRFKDLPDKALAEAVETLVKDAEGSAKR
jgi:thiol-disulfide isomerase/thioredoxin